MKLMRYKKMMAALGVGLGLALVFGMSGCGSSHEHEQTHDMAMSHDGMTHEGMSHDGMSMPAPAAQTAPATAPAASSASATSDPNVTIDNFVFKPARITVKVGTTVTWTNADDVPHTVTASVKPRAFDSKTLDTDQKFSFTFTTPGTYDYFCAVHPHMTGTVIVTP